MNKKFLKKEQHLFKIEIVSKNINLYNDFLSIYHILGSAEKKYFYSC